MAIDPAIALSGRPIQLDNPLERYSMFQNIASNSLKQKAMQDAFEVKNKLRGLIESGVDIKSPEFLKQVYAISPDQGFAYESQIADLANKRGQGMLQQRQMALHDKQLADNSGQFKNAAQAQSHQLAQQQKMAELQGIHLKNARNLLPTVDNQESYDAWRADTVGKLPNAEKILPVQYSPEAKQKLMHDADTYIDQVNKDRKVATQGIDLSEDQAKAVGFSMNAINANEALNSLEDSGFREMGAVKRSAESIPLIGGHLGTLSHWTQSAEQQQVEQGQRSFVNAINRRESGAAISDTEWENAKKTYFPQPGEDAKTIAQKRRAREIAIQGIKYATGEAAPDIQKFEKEAKQYHKPTAENDPLGFR